MLSEYIYDLATVFIWKLSMVKRDVWNAKLIKDELW